MAIIFDINPASHEARFETDKCIGLYDRVRGVLPADTLTEVTKAVTGYRAAQNAAQAVPLPDLAAIRAENVTRLADACQTRDGYTVKELTTAAREITTAQSLTDTARDSSPPSSVSRPPACAPPGTVPGPPFSALSRTPCPPAPSTFTNWPRSSRPTSPTPTPSTPATRCSRHGATWQP